MLRKRFRIVVDVDIDVEDITVERFAIERNERTITSSDRRNVRSAKGIGLTTLDRLEAERDLLNRLLQEPPVLDLWLKRRIIEHLDDHGLDDVYDRNREEPDEEVLRPLIAALPLPSRAFFHSAAKRDRLVGSLPEFYKSFEPRVRDLCIVEVDRPIHRRG